MICLVDLGHVYWRAWHGSKGSTTDAYMAAVSRLETLATQGGRLVVCCDSRSARRCELFPEYKANRAARPKEAYESLDDVQDWAIRNGYQVELCDGYEADDLIATFCARCWDPIEIISEDKDLYALVTDVSPVTMLTRNGTVDEAACVAKFGVPPRLIPDLLAMWGDTADNIPGVNRIGNVGAAALLNRFGSIAGVQAASDEEILAVKGIGKTALENLRAWDPTLARALVALDTDAPIRLEAA